ncbi:MAG TPA: UDP-N-acetylmuramoyl-L-alanine--D-glutamate ligase [Solirubrobacteraceae bacterium]|jgi:UDP-N-acetylmuramoylalanine--D-glutamate ligase|nr:UDP-N-acetylmuramoyl-L-alanine--D-glutamate ligase [Solirubrobacteraceae bacterium]
MSARPPIPPGPYLIVGLARSGKAAARLLHERGEQVIAVDVGAPPAMEALAAQGVELHLGDDGLAQLERAGAVVKSPGVPAQAPVIAAARARGLPVLGELELAWRLLPNELIAVTGTNGKTTTVELIGHIHREAGLPVAVAGNVGTALSGLVGTIDERATVVCETSSFQLEDAREFAPETAVLLNITPDHLDRHGTFAAYRAAKLRIFAHQREGDVAVLPEALADVELRLGVRRVYFDADPRPAITGLRLRGEHNRRNALAAAAVCLTRGIDPDAVGEGLRTFGGVPHRLQEVGCRDGVVYVNDSKATNVASTLMALRAFPQGGVHLILGGQSKDQDFVPLREAVAASCRRVYLIGEDAPQIAAALAGAGAPLRECGDLERAVAAASRAANEGETVLLSPACASFDQFADFEARGERFVVLVAGVV